MTFPATLFTPVGMILAIPIDPKAETLAWGISEQLEEKDRQGWKEYEVSGKAARSVKSHYADCQTEPIGSLLDNAKDTECRLWAFYSIPDLPIWHSSRVCLIGDAAHALPANGQGAAQALEDAAYMGRLLSSEEATSKGFDAVFRHFETVRRARINEVKRLAKAAGTVKSKSGPWAWWLKQWAIWAFFTVWNRGVVRSSSITTFDVQKADIRVV
jgi:2-polyprenyl-6-methoxyphenol hydroxylase-like FAD-dependent oxidoreductase